MQQKLVVSNGLRFREDMKYGEDTLFVFETCLRIKDTWVRLEKPIYLYRQVSTSAVHDMSLTACERRYHDRVTQIRTIKSYFDTEYLADPQLCQAIKQYTYKLCYMMLHECTHTSYSPDEIIQKLKSNNILPLKLNLAFIPEQNTLKEKILVLRNCIIFRFIPLYRIFIKLMRNKHGR